MDLKESLIELGDSFELLKDRMLNEAGTKKGLIEPFLRLLGYDPGNLLEVTPEFTADIGEKNGEKADYALLKNDKPIVLVECKHWNKDLSKHTSQLSRYFTSKVESKFGLLTNGLQYRFFADLENTNVMDSTPFLEIDITNIKREEDIEALKQFRKDSFVEEDIYSKANELKHIRLLRQAFEKEMKDPSEDFIRHFVKKSNIELIMTDKNKAYLRPLLIKTANQTVDRLMKQRWESLTNKNDEAEKSEDLEAVEEAKGREIITTPEELEAFHIVRSLLMNVIDFSRVSYKDSLDYFSVTVDDKITKLICRFRFNRKKKYIGFLDDKRKETKIELENMESIYSFKEQLQEQARKFQD